MGEADAPRPPAAASRRRRALRAITISALAAFLLVAVLAAVLMLTSDYDRLPTQFYGRPGNPALPAWADSCRRKADDADERYVLSCGRVRGRAVHVEARDPDGDGDLHAVVVAGARLVIIKYRVGSGEPVEDSEIPGLGETVEAAGTVTKGRWGLDTINAAGRRPSR